MVKTFLFLLPLFYASFCFCQVIPTDSSSIDYQKIYSFCLDANVKPALNILYDLDPRKLSDKDQRFRSAFEHRFGFARDLDDYSGQADNAVSNLFSMYREYWRISLLDSSANLDSAFSGQLVDFLNVYIVPLEKMSDSSETIDTYLKSFLSTKGYFTTGFGKTGRLFDLLIWKKQEDTTYVFSTGNEKTNARVIFMDDFLTLGWEQYATLDHYYPGGWATDTALYCVKQAYDLKSEDFLISYLAHESRHFADYKLFPKLTPADLEYRAKLTELSLADSTLYSLIGFFISNGNYESENAHSVADYCAIRDLSLRLFKKKYETDLTVWKNAGTVAIHAAAKQLLIENTKALHALGPAAGKTIYIRMKK